jgi:hypothetical protein
MRYSWRDKGCGRNGLENEVEVEAADRRGSEDGVAVWKHRKHLCKQIVWRALGVGSQPQSEKMNSRLS